jgi:phenylpyruvate tautomerase PptA (4-oxalocrotonate tautomerase family)
MPLLKVDTTERLDEEKKASLCAKLSSICAKTIGKPESYVMVVVSDGATMSLGGKPGPAAFADVRSIGGLSGKVNQILSEKICAALAEAAKIPADRVYLNFTSVDGADWGHNSSTFG